MSTESLDIEEVTDLHHVLELARLADLALQPDGFHALVNKYGLKTIHEDTFDKLTAAIEDPQSHVFRAVLTTIDDDGTAKKHLVGLAQWYVGYLIIPKMDPFAPKNAPAEADKMTDVNEIATAEANGKASTIETAVKIKPEINPNPLDAVTRESGNSHIRAIRGKRHIYLRRMIVHPDYQRRGIGQKLLQWGIDVADRENIVSWLFARPAGSRLYEKNGWKAVDNIAVDVPGLDVAPTISMLRLPEPRDSFSK